VGEKLSAFKSCLIEIERGIDAPGSLVLDFIKTGFISSTLAVG
jgi:hypothetical protein